MTVKKFMVRVPVAFVLGGVHFTYLYSVLSDDILGLDPSYASKDITMRPEVRSIYN